MFLLEIIWLENYWNHVKEDNFSPSTTRPDFVKTLPMCTATHTITVEVNPVLSDLKGSGTFDRNELQIRKNLQNGTGTIMLEKLNNFVKFCKIWQKKYQNSPMCLKFSFFKKATKFETNFHMIWRLLSKRQIKRKMVLNFWGLIRMSEL